MFGASTRRALFSGATGGLDAEFDRFRGKRLKIGVSSALPYVLTSPADSLVIPEMRPESHFESDSDTFRALIRHLSDFPANEQRPISSDNIAEFAGFVCLSVHRAVVDGNDRASAG